MRRGEKAFSTQHSSVGQRPLAACGSVACGTAECGTAELEWADHPGRAGCDIVIAKLEDDDGDGK